MPKLFFKAFFSAVVGLCFICSCDDSSANGSHGSSPWSLPGFLKQFVSNQTFTRETAAELHKNFYLAGVETWSFSTNTNRLNYLDHLAQTYNGIRQSSFNGATSAHELSVVIKGTQMDLKSAVIALRFRRDEAHQENYRLEKFASLYDNFGFNAELIHVSISPDRTTVSLTISLPDYATIRNPIVTIYFRKYPEDRYEKAFTKADPRYKYLLEHEEKVFRLPMQNRNVFKFCSTQTLPKTLRENVSRSIKVALDEWQAIVGDKFQLIYAGEDLNCEPPGNVSSEYQIYVMPTVKTYGPGVTIGTFAVDFFEKTLLPGVPSIYLFPQWSDPNWNRRGEGLTGRNTIRHEIGHVLGLGHQEDAPSTMSHTRPSATLTDYDRDALNALY